MGNVVYLTGAPATGKSTLSRNLRAAYPDLLIFAYSEELRRHVSERDGNRSLAEDDMRRQSSQVITLRDVEDVDKKLVEFVAANRNSRHILIDSHAVTKESYGFRVTAFSPDCLRAVSPDVIVCLYASSDVIMQRIARTPMGRPAVSKEEAAMHTELQANLAVQYGLILGKAVHLLDSSMSEAELVATLAARAKLSTA